MLGQRPIEIWWNSRLGALFFVERRFQVTVKISSNKRVKHLLGIALVPSAQEVEPLGAIGHMGDFFAVDRLQGVYCVGLSCSLKHFMPLETLATE